MTMPDQVEVTQEDREAAADYILFCSTQPNTFVDHLREGKADDTAIAQAFARHRQAAVQKARADALGEVVAWLREQSDEGAKWAGKYDNRTKRMVYGGGSYALAKAADAIERGDHLPAIRSLTEREVSREG